MHESGCTILEVDVCRQTFSFQHPTRRKQAVKDMPERIKIVRGSALEAKPDRNTLCVGLAIS